MARNRMKQQKDSSSQALPERSTNDKFILLFEAAKISLLTSNLLLQRIKTQLNNFEILIDSKIDLGDSIAMPFIEVSAFVDYSNRFYSIVDALPLINKKDPAIVGLKESMKNVVGLRNYLQHMRGDLSSNSHIKHPILGSLSWISNEACYVIFMAQTSQAEAVSITYDTKENRWVTNYQYEINDQQIHLDNLCDEMKMAYDFLTSRVTFSDPEFSKLKWGKSQALSMRMNF